MGTDIKPTSLSEGEVAPDRNCITLPNGDCVGVAGCMHDASTARKNEIDNARMRDVLEFYADPVGKCDQIPDFYSELDFGSRARDALESISDGELSDPSLEGYAAWQRGVSLNGGPHGASPYTAGSDEERMWVAGWLDAERDNGRFRVGA